MRTIGRRLTAAGLAVALLVGGAVAFAPAATADSRCSTSNHTHGALWWKRTDVFLSKQHMGSNVPKERRYAYLHTNSDYKGCAS